MGYKKKRVYDWRDNFPKTPEHPLGFLLAYIPLDGDQILVFRDYGRKMYLSTPEREAPYLQSDEKWGIKEDGRYIHPLLAKKGENQESLINRWQEWKSKPGEPITYHSVEKGYGSYGYNKIKPGFLFATADGVVEHPTVTNEGNGRWGEGIWRISLARAVAAFFGLPDHRAMKKSQFDMLQWSEAKCDDPRVIVEYTFCMVRLYRDGQIVAMIH